MKPKTAYIVPVIFIAQFKTIIMEPTIQIINAVHRHVKQYFYVLFCLLLKHKILL